MVVNQRNELVLQRDDEERMIENDEQIEQARLISFGLSCRDSYVTPM